MRFFARPEYRSEFTRFLDEWKAKRPDVETRQASGRALLWDTGFIDLDEQRRLTESKVVLPPGVYA